MSVATEHALATIASILHRPDLSPAVNDAGPPKPVEKATEAEGYSKTGPGPMAAIRFKWTVRRGDDGHYVDETVGTNSVPISKGPLSAEAAIQLVDERAAEAHARFEALKSEMIGHSPPPPPTAIDGT